MLWFAKTHVFHSVGTKFNFPHGPAGEFDETDTESFSLDNLGSKRSLSNWNK